LPERALGDPKGSPPTGDLFCGVLFIIKIKNMKKFIKENWLKVVIIFTVIIITAGLFYWYEWRPNEIRKNCANETKKSVILSKLHDNLYNQCLRENGL